MNSQPRTSLKGQKKLNFTVVGSGSGQAHVRNIDYYSRSSARHKQLTSGLIDMMLPLNIVESTGFRKFMSLTDGRYEVPSRRNITRQLTNDIHVMKQSIADEIKAITAVDVEHNRVHATVDLWSSRSMEPILGIRFHYMKSDYHVAVKTVAFRHFGERHTAINIASAFEEVLTDYGISLNSFGYQVTDNASNMLKAFDLFSMHAQMAPQTENQADTNSNQGDPTYESSSDDDDGELVSFARQQQYDDLFADDNHIPEQQNDDVSESQSQFGFGISCVAGIRLPCIAHTLQLALKDAVKKSPLAEKVLKEANAAVVFFHRSLYWGNELKKSTGGRTLLASVVTRWNSNLVMLRRIGQEQVWKAVGEILSRARSTGGSGCKSVPRFTVNRQHILDIMSILTPFEEATNSLQGDGITISSVIPALTGIDAVLSQMHTQFNTLQQHLRSALRERFHDIVRREEYILATVLDNRYKLFAFSDTLETERLEGDSSSTLKPPTKGMAKRTLSVALEKAKTYSVVRYFFKYKRISK